MSTSERLSLTLPVRPGGRITLCALLMIVLAAIAPHRLSAQEMDLPVSIQVPLFLKVMTFDRQRNLQNETSLVVGIAYQSGFRASATTRTEVERHLRNSTERKVRVVLIDLDRDKLSDIMSQQHVTVLYVAPLRAFSIADIASAATAAHVTTITGVPTYVQQGLSVGARLQSERPKLLVNITASRKCGADFTSELLKLAEVIE